MINKKLFIYMCLFTYSSLLECAAAERTPYAQAVTRLKTTVINGLPKKDRTSLLKQFSDLIPSDDKNSHNFGDHLYMASLTDALKIIETEATQLKEQLAEKKDKEQATVVGYHANPQLEAMIAHVSEEQKNAFRKAFIEKTKGIELGSTKECDKKKIADALSFVRGQIVKLRKIEKLRQRVTHD